MKKKSTTTSQPLKKKRKRASRKDTNTYVNQAEFMEELKCYYKSDVISEQLTTFVKKISKGHGGNDILNNFILLELLIKKHSYSSGNQINFWEIETFSPPTLFLTVFGRKSARTTY